MELQGAVKSIMRLLKSVKRVIVNRAKAFISVCSTQDMVTSSVTSYPGSTMSNSIDRDLVSIAIDKLWSANDVERTAGIKQLQQLGKQTIKPLVSLLSDLVNRQEPRFSSENQAEGNRALQEYVIALRKSSERDGTRHDEIKRADDRLSALSINSRLMVDVVDLLGRLEAKQSVPILIEIMNRHRFVGLGVGGGGGPEQDALCRIGRAAVPKLIEALDERNIQAYRPECVVYGYSVRVAAAANSESSEVVDLAASADDDCFVPAKLEDDEINLIRERVVGVLGEIADATALPPLQELLKTTRDAALKLRVKEAIRKIEGTRPDSFHQRLLLPLRPRDRR